MNKHIYMSVGTKQKDGSYVDRFKAVSNFINYRGRADSDGDIPSFTLKMAKKGAIVISSTTPLKPNSVVQYDGRDFVIKYPPCFDKQMDSLFPKISIVE